MLSGMRRLEASGFAGGAALATLTRSRGSTFRRPGARMLVFGDGTVVRGLSGGCPEADIAARAADIIASDTPRIVRYNSNNVFDPMVEMGCGGDIEVLIEPLNCAADLKFLFAVEQNLNARKPGYLATLFARNGECLAPRPRRLFWTGRVEADEIGDEPLTDAIVEVTMKGDLPKAATCIDTQSGVMDVLIEKLQPPHMLVLVGVNAVSRALAQIGMQLGWLVTIVDHRGLDISPSQLPSGARIKHLRPEEIGRGIVLDEYSSVVVMTHKLDTDITYLKSLTDTPVSYLGTMGSRTRAARICEATGLGPPQLHAPAGLDIGSETPEEIALSIAAEILAVNSSRQGRALSELDGPIH